MKDAKDMQEKEKEGNKEEKKEDEKKNEEPPEIVLKVDMHCEACARKVARALKGFEGFTDPAFLSPFFSHRRKFTVVVVVVVLIFLS